MGKKLEIKKLGTRQVFAMKKESLEARFVDYYEENSNASYLIQCAVAVLVRNAFSALDFSFLAKDLIRELFLTSDSVGAARKYCIYFQNYFSDDEWQKVITRLFADQKEFERITENTRLTIEPLLPILHSKCQESDKKLNLKAAFKDETGKMHSWSLGNVVRRLEPLEHRALVSILGDLTIFKTTDGARRFAQVIWVDFAVDERERDFDIRKEDNLTTLEESAQPPLEDTLDPTDFSSEPKDTTPQDSEKSANRLGKPVDAPAEEGPPQKEDKQKTGTTNAKPKLTFEDIQKQLRGRLSKKNKGKQQPPFTGKKKKNRKKRK
ncbi:hypothetical protein [Enterococcus sp. AZ109]|uniref:hypothetical protein n=1 Tax=Enterococcus sp. AZ109 TaxID=2774634 RepID=UPI003F281C4B